MIPRRACKQQGAEQMLGSEGCLALCVYQPFAFMNKPEGFTFVSPVLIWLHNSWAMFGHALGLLEEFCETGFA